MADHRPNLESGQDNNSSSNGHADDADASTSHPKKDPVLRPWFEAQLECAICLSEFAKGDKVRVLPCHHIFHVEEVDEWLIHRKKLVRKRKTSKCSFMLMAQSLTSVPFAKPM